MHKILLILITLTISGFASDIKSKTGDFPQQEMKSQNKEIVKMVVAEIASTLPLKIDDYTQFVEIKGKDTTMLYYFEINTGSKSDESIQKEDKSRMKKAVTKGICQSAKRFIEAQINISYIYLSAKTKSELFRFDISHKECVGI